MANIKTIINRWWKITTIVIASIFGVAIWRFGWDWTGFGVYTGNIDKPEDRGKTLWDWMGLLIVPVFLGLIALLFSQVARAKTGFQLINKEKTPYKTTWTGWQTFFSKKTCANQRMMMRLGT